jgi:hypothetical protein
MKISLLILCLSAILVSCNEKVQENKDEDIIEESSAAYGDLQFGMSEAEVGALLKDSTDTIGIYPYGIKPAFYQGKLYSINLWPEHPYALIESKTNLKSQYESLKKVISEKYGEPTTSGFFDDIECEPEKEIDRWEMGDKVIIISVSCMSETYTLFSTIYDAPVKALVDKEREKGKDDKVKSDSEKF